ncbi:aldo/keto reductase [Exiguobacterium sp. LL15]|uniref:aldo/keto reductase n=1 Tax=Exiguobacterium sp. LL15 TaxID=2950547 RepID=UPI00210B6638|nr:aldo/keto reductase [Exiguobacterium sp. LL15]MCQ4090537.1 aldo/keto reductase [Exiguobacterium sp. LL15]
MNMKISTVRLNNGVDMPQVGYGVFRVEDGADLEQAVVTAIREGYRSIDTAAIYGNEQSVGRGIAKAIEEGLVTREELFVTSKVWNAHGSYEETLAAYAESLEKMQLEYLDLYLIHWPGKAKYQAPWKALEELVQTDKVRAIGVSNFQIHHLEDLLQHASIMPVVNQIELHPKLTQSELRQFCSEHGIQIEAWSPLMNAELLENEVVQELATQYKKSAAQIILRWDIQQGIITIPKSMTPSRMQENLRITDFEILPEDMERLNQLNENLRSGPDPDTFDF